MNREQIYIALDKLAGIYWEEIPEDDFLYQNILKTLKEECQKYDITNNTTYPDYQRKIMPTNSTPQDLEDNILLNILKECTDLDSLNKILTKYKNIFEAYREKIASYVTNFPDLGKILNNHIQHLERDVSTFNWENTKKPHIISQIDEDGWETLDENNNPITRLETQEEVNIRIEKTQIEHEELKKEIANLKNQLTSWLEFVSFIPKISQDYQKIKQFIHQLKEIENTIKLNTYKSNPKFITDLTNIMDHNPNEYQYLYHGTTCIEDAEKIMIEGLYMVSDILDRTTYSEFTLDELLLYNRGFGGEIGRDAIVIIKKPLTKNIVTPISKEEAPSLAQSGLGGLNNQINYKIPPDFILGYVNKKDQIVVFNDLSLKANSMIK